MYQITRISKVPASPMVICIADGKLAVDGTVGLAAGGQFVMETGDTATVSQHQANAIMGDASLAPHFSCTPEFVKRDPGAAVTESAPAVSDDDAPARNAARGRGGRRGAQPPDDA